MRNLKKMLAVIVAVAVMLTAMVPAFAAGLSDVAGTQYEAAANRLNGLGIITGRPDGSFAPNDSITRAEFAAVVVRALGYGSSADAAKGQTKFSDVKADHWASGYINLANTLGVISGRPDGTFAPDAKVLYEEAVTMVIRAIGYDAYAKVKGGYPMGYLNVAAEKDVLKGATSAPGVAASRGLVAKMVDNSLEVDMMDADSFGWDGKPTFKIIEGKTLLATNLKLKKLEGIVDSSDNTKKTVKINVEKVDGSTTADEVGLQQYDVFEAINLDNLSSAYVTAWMKDSKVYSIKVDSTIKYDVISKMNDSDSSTATYTVAGVDSVTLKNAGTLYDVRNLAIQIDRTSKTGSDTFNFVNKFAKVFLKDGKVYRVEAYNTTSADGLITDVKDSYIEYKENNTNEKKYRDLDKADSKLVVIDGKYASYADLKAGMYFEVSKNDKHYVIAASTATLAGKLERVKETDNKITIAGTEKDLAVGLSSSNNFISYNDGKDYNKVNFDDLLGKDVTAYLNLIGKVAYVKGNTNSATTDFYGVVTGGWRTDASYLKVYRDVDGVGQEVTYTVTSDVADATFNAAIITDDVTTGGIEGYAKQVNGEGIYKFTLNSDGKIKAMVRQNDTVAGGPGLTAAFNPDEFNKDNDVIKEGSANYYVASTKIFNIAKKSDGSFDKVTLVKWADIEGKAISSTVSMRLQVSDKSKPEVAVFNGGYDTLTGSDKFYGFITDKYRIDGDYFEMVLETPEGSKTLKIDEDDDAVTNEAIKNDFIQYTVDGDKIKVRAILDATYAAPALNGTAYNTVFTPADTKFAPATVVQSVYDIDGGFVKFNQTDASTAWVKIASDCIVFKINLKSNNTDVDNYTKSDISNIVDDLLDDGVYNNSGDAVAAYIYDGQIKGIVFVAK